MFKIGDKVESLIDDMASGKYYSRGTIYTVVGMSGSDVETIDNTGQRNGFNVKNFKLVTANVTVTPVFKIGDRIRYIGQCYASRGGLPKGAELHIISLHSGGMPFELKDSNGKNWSNSSSLTSYELINPSPMVSRDLKGYAIKINPVAELKPCTCPSLELFRKGCQCGAIVKKQWGLLG